ncbi:MAG: hypothetical protein WC858_05235 [Parcubacteria group bacterium]|jgi:hypothetical protein
MIVEKEDEAMSLKKLAPTLTIIICMGPGKEEKLREKLKEQLPDHKRTEFILCDGNVDEALLQVRSAKPSRPEVNLYTDRFLPGGDRLFQLSISHLSQYNVFFA